MDSFVAEKIHNISRKLLDNINKSLSTPYFTRVDFTASNDNKMQLYIGKWGVTDTRTQMPVIIDWRSPIANLYYTHQVGEASYTTPEGEVHGEITLKRLFEIKDAEIKSIIEADIISEGDYLNDVLSDHADSRLKDIVTTIQSEQNAVLRCNHKIPLIVQGVAGAGKTTIALHRIMWMLYTFQETMEPANIMVIAPSPLFLDYISAVLPEMGVEDVIQETFYGLALRLCGTKLFKPDDSYILLKLLDNHAPDEEKEYYRSYAQFKGSLVFKEILLRYISHLSDFLLPSGGISFEGREILSEDKIKNIYNKELAPFNMTDRKKELKKSLKNVINSFIISEKTSLEMKAKKRANLIRELYKNDATKRQSLMQELYAKRDSKLEELARFSATAVEEYIKKINILSLLESYKHFLNHFLLPDEFSDYAEQWTAAKKITLANLENKKIETSDIPPLLIIQNTLFGYKERLNIHHTVLDEAQDFSPFMFDTLKTFTRNNSFTIVGDLAQGIYAYQGVQDWLKMKDNVFGESSQYYELVTSYRNTVEIMELAESCAMRHSPNRTPATPVLRHGSQPKLIKTTNIAENIAAEIAENIKLGMKTIAVIDKMPDDCINLYNELKKHIPDIAYLDDKDTVYQGGIMVMPAYLCKGLEFDCVIIANCESDNFKDDFLHSRLLYVCLTRPIHKLSIYYSHIPTELINRHLCENIEI
ncbi:MAG: UvrD-helicase domain-containing protein [Clostridia bacterium]|nr:UvrD-helicase domain-containing protein [Clostridia bacterium]